MEIKDSNKATKSNRHYYRICKCLQVYREDKASEDVRRKKKGRSCTCSKPLQLINKECHIEPMIFLKQLNKFYLGNKITEKELSGTSIRFEPFFNAL